MVLQIGAGLATWLVLDFLWLGLLMNGFYKAQLGTLARRSGENFAPLWTPAILLYVLVVIAIAVFVVPRAAGSLLQAAAYGAFFGLVAFGVYDLTNYATLDPWPLALTVVDMAWGAFVCAAVTVAMVLVGGGTGART
jgi:uncharacterized membrane protein